MRFEWDERKNRSNKEKHGISFEQATGVFDDPYIVSQRDDDSFEEERYRLLGRVEQMTILFVVVTYRDEHGEDITRIISARRAKPFERRTYERESAAYRQL
jgi:uncharacterized DUF497 family protein